MALALSAVVGFIAGWAICAFLNNCVWGGENK